MRYILILADLLGLVACLATLLAILRIELRRRVSTHATIVFSFLVFSIGFLMLSNALESVFDNPEFEPVENIVMMILPFIWGIFFFVLGQTLQHRRLEQRESRLRALFAHTADPLMVFDTDLQIVEANQQALSSLGYSYSELLSMRIPDIEIEHDEAALKDILQSTVHGKPITITGTHRCRSSATIPVEIRIQEFEFEGSECFLALARDISKRLQAQRAAEENAARSQAMSERLQMLHEVGNSLQQAPDFDVLCYWAVELGKDRLDLGRLSLKLYDEEHYQSEATFGTNAQGDVIDERGQRMRLISKELRQQMSQRIPGHITQNDVTLFDGKKNLGQGQQVLAPLFDGSSIIGYLETDNYLTRQPVPEENKQLLALYASTVGHMIGRFRRDEKIRRNEQFLRDIFDSFQSGLTVIDFNMNVVRTNRYMREKYHLSESNIRGKCYKVFHHGESACEDCPTRAVFETGEPHRTTLQSFDPGLQEERYIEIASFPMHDENGQIRWAIEFSTDVTEEIRKTEERKRFEEQMQMTQKLESLGVLAGGVAHDFNNLLMGIQGNADLALDTIEAGHEARFNVEGISESAQRASELCQQMLAYAGRGNFVVEDIDLDALLHDMESLFSSAMPRKSECHIEVPPDLPAIRADKTQIRQLFMNLVTNSGEAMEENPGTVDVSLELVETHEGEPASVYTGQAPKPGSYIQICVSDTGCGMDEETLKNLFDPFFSTKFQGRGLGMAAVLGIVRSYEGDVQVESEIGKGTKVTVRLPAEDHVVDENPVSNHNFEEEFVENAPEGIILLVDDEFVVRQVGTGMLERLGFDVVTAEDGLEGVNKFKELNERVLFVILDMTMPKMDGEEALRAMRAVRPEVPILISSGYTEQEILSRFSDEHISGFVSKPYSMKGLQTSTNQVIRELQASGRV